MKVFKDGTIARLVDYVEGGVKKSRLSIFPKDNPSGLPIERLSTRRSAFCHESRTQHTFNADRYIGEAYTEGIYKTTDRFYNQDGTLKCLIEGSTTPAYEKKYGTCFNFSISGVPHKNVPWYLQWTQSAEMASDGTLKKLKEGLAGKRIEIPLTPEVKEQYKVLENIAKKPLNLLNIMGAMKMSHPL